MDFLAFDSPTSSPSLSPFASPRQSPCTTPSPHPSPKLLPQQVLPTDRGKYLGLLQDQIELKVLLLSRLREYNFRGMSGGFPFRVLHNGHGQLIPSFDTYHFKEPLYTSTGMMAEAIVSFTNPNSVFADNSELFSWTICLPAAGSAKPACMRSSQLDAGSSGFIVAAVRIDPTLHTTPWFQSDQFTKDLYNALAFSLEQGCTVVIQRSRTNMAEVEWQAYDPQTGSRRTLQRFMV